MTTEAVAPLMERIETITVAEAEVIAAGGAAEVRDRLRKAARDEAWNAGVGKAWSEVWDTAFKAGVTPAAAASKARRESGEWTSSETVASDPAWMSMWSAAWPNLADAVAAVAFQDSLNRSVYDALTQPLRTAIGPELPGEGGPDDDQPTTLS